MKPSIALWQIASMNYMYKLYSLDYYIDCVERIGYKSVAFWAGPPHFSIDGEAYQDASALKKKLAAHGLSCTCWTTPALLPPNQFAIEGAQHIEDTYRYFANGVLACAQAGSQLMICNSGYGLRTHSQSDAWKRSRDMMWRIAEFASKHGVVITMESLRPQETNLAFTLKQTRKMIDEVNHPNLKAMIDTTAMGVSGETIWQWFDEFGDDLVNLHFIDGNPYGHLAWGDGTCHLADMLECLQAHGYQGPIGLEVVGDRYNLDPAAADAQCFKNLIRYVD